MKTCKSCQQEKGLTEYWKSKNHRDGLDSRCISCRKKFEAHYKAHPARNGIGRKPRIAIEGMRWCSLCKQALPVACFTGTERTCKPCKQDRHYLRTYGITRKDYNEMIKNQNGTCAICRRREPIYVDHDHKTGQVRGILCQQCNTGLGYFFDDCEIIQRAAAYCAAIARNE